MPFHGLGRPFVLALLSSAVAACGGGTAGGDPGTPAIAVVVQPPTASVPVSGAAAFTATVTSSVDTSVTWTVEPGGCGSVTQSGGYAAPATTGTCIVRATSRADPSRSGSATVTVTASVGPPPDPISPERPRPARPAGRRLRAPARELRAADAAGPAPGRRASSASQPCPGAAPSCPPPDASSRDGPTGRSARSRSRSTSTSRRPRRSTWRSAPPRPPDRSPSWTSPTPWSSPMAPRGPGSGRSFLRSGSPRAR